MGGDDVALSLGYIRFGMPMTPPCGCWVPKCKCGAQTECLSQCPLQILSMQ